MPIHTVGKTSYHVSPGLYHYWKKYSLASMKKVNRDKVDIIDGSEGTGKSFWAIQQFAFIEPSAFSTPENFVSRIAFSTDEFLNLVRTVKNGVIIFDEAFRGFSSRSALSKINKELIQALMEMRQNNNILLVVLPSFYLLDVYPAMLRSNSLFHIYIDKKSGKRVWKGYNKADKNRMYQMSARKGWNYPLHSRFKGNFYNKFPGGEEFLKAYLDKKQNAFRNTAIKEADKPLIRVSYIMNVERTRYAAMNYIYQQTKSIRALERVLKQQGYPLDFHQIKGLLERKGKSLEPELEKYRNLPYKTWAVVP